MAEKFTLKLDLDTAQAIAQGKDAANQIAKESSKAAKHQLAAVLAELKSANAPGMKSFSWGTDDPNSWKGQFSPTDIGPGSKSMLQLKAGLVEFKKLMQGYSGAIPPIIQAAGGRDWKKLFIGAAAGVFSPWIGGKMMSDAWFGGKGGGSGGGRGGMGGSLLGAGGMGGFAGFYLLIQGAKAAIQFAMRQISQAIQEGSKLFQDAARTARPMAGLFQLQSAFGAIGLSPQEAIRMLSQGQFSAGRGRFVGGDEAFGNVMKAMSSSGQMGDMQQLMNMSEQFKRMWNESRQSGAFAANASPENQAVNEMFESMKREWKALWMQIVAALAPVIRLLGNELVNALQALNQVIDFYVNGAREFGLLLQKLSLIIDPTGNLMAKILAATGTTQPGNNRIGNAQVMGPVSQWERMGLIVNGGLMGNNYAQQTAQNTRRIVEILGGGSNFNQFMPSSSNHSLP